jgi:hypothetical protein
MLHTIAHLAQVVLLLTHANTTAEESEKLSNNECAGSRHPKSCSWLV